MAHDGLDMSCLKIALAQISPWVGDIDGNVNKVVAAARTASAQGADLVVFPEMALLGYPADDLLFRSGLPAAIEAAWVRLERELPALAVVVGTPEYSAGVIYNSAIVFVNGERRAIYRKQCLPNYGVFDERRHFQAGTKPCVVTIADTPVGITICEDFFVPGPAIQARDRGAELLVNLSASPFAQDKMSDRQEAASARADATGLPVVYVNCVGGQDELVFDGRSMFISSDGQRLMTAPAFETGVYLLVVEDGVLVAGVNAPDSDPEPEALVYQALVHATRDYVERNAFPGVLVGLSGGIDSALTVAIAADALGPERVWAVSMPSRYTAAISNEDAAAQARALGVRYDELSIESVFQSYLTSLEPLFGDRAPDTAEENLQPRARGTLLMALSNKFGHLVLAPGNKSELAVGYSTIYGDMCGGFAPLKDIYKTWVYRLSRHRNRQGPTIPERVLERAPSAELREGQTDRDSLPDYPQLDAILEAYIENHRSIAEITASGEDEAVVRQVVGLVRRSEYKRRQAPPGPKVTHLSFGRERRYPITAVHGDL